MATATTIIEMPATPTNQQNGSSALTQIPLEPFAQANGQVVQARERWNRPRINTYRLAAIFFAFLVFGMNDGSYGALVPYVRPNTPSPQRISWLIRLDRTRLSFVLHRHLLGIPLALRRLYGSRPFQRPLAHVRWTARYCHNCTVLQSHQLCCHCCTPSLPGRRCYPRNHRLGQWPTRRGLECLDRYLGPNEPIAGAFAWVLRAGCNHQSTHLDLHDHPRPFGMVDFLLHHDRSVCT